MDIYPQDLGQSRQIALLRRRTSSLTQQTAVPELGGTSRHIGWLGRQWTRGTGLPPNVSAATLDAMRPTVNGFVCGFSGGSTGFWLPGIGLACSGEPTIGVILASQGAAMTATGFLLPGVWLRRIARRPISAGEIEAMMAGARDDLERTYLALALDAVRQPLSRRRRRACAVPCARWAMLWTDCPAPLPLAPMQTPCGRKQPLRGTTRPRNPTWSSRLHGSDERRHCGGPPILSSAPNSCCAAHRPCVKN